MVQDDIPKQPLFDLVNRVICDAADDVADGLRVHAFQLYRIDQAIETGGALPASI